MNLEKQCCSLDLAIKLNELGITQKSWFYWKQNEIQTVVTERQMKEWQRNWKKDLIEKDNPNWRDLYDDII